MIRVYDVCIYLYIHIHSYIPGITKNHNFHGPSSARRHGGRKDLWHLGDQQSGELGELQEVYREDSATDYSVTNNFKLCSELTYQDMVRWLVIAR